MIRETISEIEAKLQNSASISPEAKRELTELLARLKGEVTDLARTDAEKAQNIASFAQASTNEATRPEKDQEQLKVSIDSLSGSVEGFEESHPQLVQVVNRICTTLANLGI
jgi:hypothetical protein